MTKPTTFTPGHSFPAARARRAGSALVMIMVVLSLLSIIVVTMMISMRTDRIAGRSFYDSTQAHMFSEQGVNHAVALLRQLSGRVDKPWAVRPGQGYYPAAGTLYDTVLELSSGLGTAPDAANLNLAGLTGENPIDPAGGQPLKVKWIHVYQDGSISEDPPTAFNTTNPVVGRYGFWVDTESSRINWNTAWRGGAGSSETPTPDKVDLTALAGLEGRPDLATQIHGYVKDTRLLNSPEDVRAIGEQLDPPTDLSAIASANRFSTTHFSHDLERTFWGEPKIYLTTQLANLPPEIQALPAAERSKYFLDILKVDNTDPGYFGIVSTTRNNIDQTKFKATVTRVAEYLARADWPVAPADNPSATLAAKYFTAPTAQSVEMQMALSILDYVRSKESALQFVQPSHGAVKGGAFYFYPWDSYRGQVHGQSRQLCITELALWISSTPTVTTDTPPKTHFPARLIVEVYWPENYGVSGDSYDMRKLRVWTQLYQPWSSSQVNDRKTVGTGGVTATPTTIRPGEYSVIVFPINIPGTNPGSNVPLCVSIFDTNLGNGEPLYNGLDWTSPAYQGDGMLVYSATRQPEPFDPGAISIPSLQVDDPRVNKHLDDWRQAGNTFGSANTGISTLGKAPVAGLAEQDTDVAGKVTDAGFRMPPPKGSAGNPDGKVKSVAELGGIMTGGLGTNKAGVPWRTLRFQPMKAKGSGSSAYLPDWVVMDLFTVPRSNNANDVSERLVRAGAGYADSNGAPDYRAGRININSLIAPFETDPADPMTLDRTTPLMALLQGAFPTGTGLLTALHQQTLAPLGAYYSGSDEMPPFYGMRGALAEVAGVADQGEASEERLQNFVDLTTSQSGVFRVYSVGQSLRFSKNNKLLVTGERRGCTLIERFVEADQVKFRPIYRQNLTP